MIRKALSLLLSFLVLNVQLMAAGPFDAYIESVTRPLTAVNSGSAAATEIAFSKIAGTYGVTLTGINTEHESTTGTMLLSVPSRGLAVGKVILFDQGLVYIGSATGVFRDAYLSAGPFSDIFTNSRSGYSSLNSLNKSASGTLICQLAHYSVRVQTDGLSATAGPNLDGMMNGVLNLQMIPSTVISPVLVEGDGSLWHYETRLLNVVSTTMTRDGSNQLDSPGSNPTNFTSTITITGAEPGDLSNLIQGGKIPDAGNSDWLSTNGFDSPNLINTDAKSAYVSLYLEGEMQSTSTSTLALFQTPNDGSNWGVGLNANGTAPASPSAAGAGGATGGQGTNPNSVQVTFPPGFFGAPAGAPANAPRSDGIFSR